MYTRGIQTLWKKGVEKVIYISTAFLYNVEETYHLGIIHHNYIH